MFFFVRYIVAFVFFLFFGTGASYTLFKYNESFISYPSFEANTLVKPSESIVVTFKKPVLPQDYREAITITPPTAVYAKWENDFTSLVFTPKDHWEPETTYTFTLPRGRANNFTTIGETTFSFQTIPYPTLESVSPTNKSLDVLLGIEDPIIVTLKDSSKDFFIDFRFSPTQEVAYEVNEDRTRFKLLPKTPLEEGKLYTLDIYASPKDNTENPKKIGSSSFTTLPPRPQTWPKNMDERVAQAKRFAQPKMKEGKYIDINLSAQLMTIFENGLALDVYPISSGKRGMDTPKGTYTIQNKANRPWSKQYSLYMPNWMALVPSGKYGIHELPEWPGGYKEGANHLGVPVSHGCVRLGVGPAKHVFDWTAVGTPVVIY